MKTGNKAEPASYYDDVYKNGGKNQNYLKHYSQAAHYPIWAEALRHIPKKNQILEIGCGTGQLADFLIKSGFNYITGLDFSDEALKIAKKNVLKAEFFNLDIEKESILALNSYKTIIATEVLEHINNDLKLINSFPKGIQFIATVPNFGGKSHVRFFQSKEEIRRRYKDLLDFQDIIPFKNKHTLYLIIATKK